MPTETSLTVPERIWLTKPYKTGGDSSKPKLPNIGTKEVKLNWEWKKTKLNSFASVEVANPNLFLFLSSRCLNTVCLIYVRPWFFVLPFWLLHSTMFTSFKRQWDWIWMGLNVIKMVLWFNFSDDKRMLIKWLLCLFLWGILSWMSSHFTLFQVNVPENGVVEHNWSIFNYAALLFF